MTAKGIKNIMASGGLAPARQLGQNFLVHHSSAERIVQLAGVSSTDTVLEVGVGFGALTRPLSRQAGRVIGLEVDAGIVRWHQREKNLPENVTLLHRNILETDLSRLAREHGGLKIIANLPYSISNPFLFRLLDQPACMHWAVLMLQKEVARRLVAAPGTKEYGILTILTAAEASVATLLHLGPGHFYPRPRVDSRVIRLDFRPRPARVACLPPYDRELFRRLVKAAFQQRRKTLLNALSAALSPEWTKPRLAEVIQQTGLSADVRGEALTLEHYVRLTNNLKPERG